MALSGFTNCTTPNPNYKKPVDAGIADSGTPTDGTTCGANQVPRCEDGANAPCPCVRDPQSPMMTRVAPALAATPDGVLLVATDVDGRIYQNRVVTGQAPQGWLELGTGGTTQSAPAVALAGNASTVYAAIRGNDDKVYVTVGTLDRKYGGWQPISGLTTYVAPVLASTHDGVLLLATDTEGRIMANRFVVGQAAQGWKEVGGNGRTDVSPAAAVTGNNKNYMFMAIKGIDGYVYINQGSIGGGEVGWKRDDQALKTDVAPTVVTTPDGAIFFAKDPSDRVLANRVVLGEATQGWKEVGGGASTKAGVAAALAGNNANLMYEAIKGSDGYVQVNRGSIGRGEVGWTRY